MIWVHQLEVINLLDIEFELEFMGQIFQIL